MENSLIQLKNELHLLAVKYHVNDEVVLEIAQNIVFCEPNYLKYTQSKTIQCENNNYYGQKVDSYKVKENLNLIQKNHEPKLFIMQKQ